MRVPIDAIIISMCREFGVREEWSSLEHLVGIPFSKSENRSENSENP